MNNSPFEKQLLHSWEEWNELDFEEIQFCECIVKRFGPFQDGDRVPCVEFDFGDSTITCYDDDNNITWKGNLILVTSK